MNIFERENHVVPGKNREVQLRRATEDIFAVRVLKILDRPVKDDWRQIGSEITFSDEQEARRFANSEWQRLRNEPQRSDS